MFRGRPIAIRFTLLLILALIATSARAATPCVTSAWNLLRACDQEIREEANVASANCVNLADSGERSACRLEAVADKGEAVRDCVEQLLARIDVCDTLDESRYDPDPLADPEIAFIDPDEIPNVYPPNPYVSLEAGHTYVLQAGDEGEETVVVHVTDQTREILGVECRVVVDIVVVAEHDEVTGELDYVPVEATDDWFAQDETGDVYYCGELSRNYEDGVLEDLDGSFEAGKHRAKAGLLIAAYPVVGGAHRQEFALGEAEDIVGYVDLAAVPDAELGGENEAYPCAPDGCLQTLEYSPLEPAAAEFKFYSPGVGFVLGVGLEDDVPTGARDELLCRGDGLELLDDVSCGIEDPALLREVLCKLSPDAICGAGTAASEPPQGESARRQD